MAKSIGLNMNQNKSEVMRVNENENQKMKISTGRWLWIVEINCYGLVVIVTKKQISTFVLQLSS